ncbi:MAG: hypothetical protein AB7I18_12795 [Candidatus Berkiella sp.]
MFSESHFLRFYEQSKQVLEKYRLQKEVELFLVTTFAELESSKSLLRLRDELSLFCRQLKAKINPIGLTAFGGTCTSCGCLKKLKVINEEISYLIEPPGEQKKVKVRRGKS